MLFNGSLLKDLPDEIVYFIWRLYFSHYIVKKLPHHAKTFKRLHLPLSYQWNSYRFFINKEY